MIKHPMIEKLGLQAFGPEHALPTTHWVVDARELETLLSNAVQVYGLKLDEGWQLNSGHHPSIDTHSALLINIQPIEPCKHEPDEIELKNEYYLGFFQPKTNAFVNEKCGESSVKVFGNKCTHCGIELVAEWKPK